MAISSYAFTASSSRTVHRRCLATSAQRRKWRKKQGDDKPFLKKKYALLAEEASKKKGNQTKPPERNWRPNFFLGVFPVFLSVAVVLSRDDLREEVNDKGIGRFLEDYKSWRRKTLAANMSNQQQQVDQDGEYDKMLNHLGLQQSVNGTSKADTSSNE